MSLRCCQKLAGSVCFWLDIFPFRGVRRFSPAGSSFFLRDDNEFLRKRCNFKKINKRGRLAGYFPAGGLPFPFPGIPDREKDPQK